MIGGLNPLLRMWTSPRPTVRAIVNVNPRFGVFYLAWGYALQSILFFVSYWSLGLSYPAFAILSVGLILSPLFGYIWLYFTGWVLHFTGGWLGGKAPMLHLRTALAWSKIPSVLLLFMWLLLMIADIDTAFVNGVAGTSSLFVTFITSILGIWSLVLLILSLQEVQRFSLARAIVNVILAGFISWILSALLFFVFRYFSLLIAFN